MATLRYRKLNTKELQDAYSLYLHTRGWYFSDYSEGVHDPRGFEKTSSEVIKKLRTATTEANKAIKAGHLLTETKFYASFQFFLTLLLNKSTECFDNIF